MIRNYFKIAWRNLIKNKGYTFINIGGLALGIGCSVLIFLFVNYHLEFDKFHKNSDRIYRIVTEEHRDYIEYEASVPPGFANAFRSDYNFAEKVAKFVDWEEELIGLEGNKKLKEEVVFVEQDFFEILNFPLINNSEVILDEPNTAFITKSLAKKLYGDESPINKTFQLGGTEIIKIIGILKDLPKTTLINGELFVSFKTLEKYSGFLSGESWRGINSSLQCFTLLHPNQNINAIEQQLSQYATKHRSFTKNVHHYKLQALADIHFDSKYSGGMNSKILWIFSIIGFFLIIIASINFINISTAQSVTRSKEVGIRKVLGSLQSHLFWQFMTETFIISLIAILLGIGLSILVLPYFNLVFNLDLSFYENINLQFIAFVGLLLVSISILAGSYPGILLAKISPMSALKRKISHKNTGGSLTRKALVTVQFVISIVLIIGTIVINKQINYAINSDLGYDKSAIVMVTLPTSIEKVGLEGLKNRISQHSGVEKITACFASPGAGDSQWGTNVQYNNNPEDENFLIQVKIADKDYLNTFNLKLLNGRNFYEKDTVDEVLVNAMFAKKLGLESTEELIGKTLVASGGYIKGTIVGVVKDFHDQDFQNSIRPIFIAPKMNNYNELAIKINMNNSQAVLKHVEEQWLDAFPDFIFEYDFYDDRISELYESEQQILSLTKLFSALAIFIGCLGIYGLVLFFVVQKTKEIGIRKVLGGKLVHILVLVMQDFFLLLAIAGIIASSLAWYFMTIWLQNYTYKTELSWWIFALSIGLVTSITFLTICYQAIKAARANPIESLRTE